MRDILAVDVGTTTFKMGVFTYDLKKRSETSRGYKVNIYDHGKADIEPGKWCRALTECCIEQRAFLSNVGVISFSVTTPGLVPMAEDGTALGPAILFFDNRSYRQAREIREKVGEEKFLRETCNLPVPGGSSLCSILWIRENQPEIWKETAKFGHCNTYMVKHLAGLWAIDPSTTSITGLYNTVRNDLTWNKDVLTLSEIPEDKLPPLMHSYRKVGKILPEIASNLYLPEDCDVLCGGNDAVLAALSGGFTEPGDINHISGTAEITNVCVDKPFWSKEFNVRCHVVPDRWVTFFVLNTGGIALDWFHSVFCKDMTHDQFYADYIPSTVEAFLNSDNPGRLESELPNYVPLLQGSRYSLERMTASFSGLTLETTRDKMLLALIKGNAIYHREYLMEMSSFIKLSRTIMASGGGAKIKGLLKAKKRWMGDFDYLYQEESSLLGAAMLGQFCLAGKYD